MTNRNLLRYLYILIDSYEAAKASDGDKVETCESILMLSGRMSSRTEGFGSQ